MFKKLTVMLVISLACVISFATDFTGATIVYPDKRNDREKPAVRELRYYLELALGKKILALPESSFKGGDIYSRRSYCCIA